MRLTLAGRRLSLALVLALVACGGSDGVADPDDDDNGNGNPDPQTRVIQIAGFAFSPADVTVTRGTTVRWVNGGGMLHTVTPDGHQQWTEAVLQDGQQFQHTFATAGTYAYYCDPHRGSGMTGVIRVQ